MSLVFEDVTRRYGDVVALNRVSLDVGPGITALVGPNGSGKSTFMRLATGHVQPTSGRIEAMGQRVWNNPELMRQVGYVPEQDAFWENMTGVEFVTRLARLGGMGPNEAERRARAELKALGLKHGLDRPIKGYSKGMRQRVKLAQALVHRPRLLFLDEPMLGCDPVARRRIQDRIRALAAYGCTVVVSTHILPEVERLTRNIAVIHGGRLIAQGDAAAVRATLAKVHSRVKVLCEDPRRAARALLAGTSVRSATVDDGAVVVETNDLRSLLIHLHEQPRPPWVLHGIEPLDNDLTTLFGQLTGGGE